MKRWRDLTEGDKVILRRCILVLAIPIAIGIILAVCLMSMEIYLLNIRS